MDINSFKRAKEIEEDVYIIERLEKSKNQRHWVAFTTPDDKHLRPSVVFQDALMKFVSEYKESIEKEFEEL